MLYRFENGEVLPVPDEEIGTEQAQKFWGLFTPEELFSVKGCPITDETSFSQAVKSRSLKFESHECFDLICLNRLNYRNVLLGQQRMLVILRRGLIAVISPDAALLSEFKGMIEHSIAKSANFDRLLCMVFEQTTSGDAACLDAIEQEISDLEDALLTSRKRNSVREIIALRKKLLILKRHYEQYLDVFDAFMENENGIPDNRSMRHYKIYAGRVDRLYRNVLNLRDYVTQVREAYQAEVDISLNYIMKLFTVITAIFLPLTLIVGWYGMNLKMPEYKWDLAYPFVITLSLAVVAACVYYFKKHKWF